MIPCSTHSLILSSILESNCTWWGSEPKSDLTFAISAQCPFFQNHSRYILNLASWTLHIRFGYEKKRYPVGIHSHKYPFHMMEWDWKLKLACDSERNATWIGPEWIVSNNLRFSRRILKVWNRWHCFGLVDFASSYLRRRLSS